VECTATELKQKSGQVLDNAQREPVKILKHGRTYAVLLSAQDYAEFEAYRQGTENPPATEPLAPAEPVAETQPTPTTDAPAPKKQNKLKVSLQEFFS